MIRSLLLAMAFAVAAFAPRAVSASPLYLNFQFSNVADPVGADYVGLYTGDPTTSNFSFAGVAALAPIPVGDSAQSIRIGPAAVSQTVPANLNDTTPITGVALLGVYNPASNTPGLTIGVDSNAVASYLGKTYSGAFPESTLSEAQAVAGLLASNVNTVGSVPVIPDSPVDENYGFAIGHTGTFVNFSTGASSGSFVASVASTPVPGPGTLTLFGFGLLCLGALLRHRTERRWPKRCSSATR